MASGKVPSDIDVATVAALLLSHVTREEGLRTEEHALGSVRLDCESVTKDHLLRHGRTETIEFVRMEQNILLFPGNSRYLFIYEKS